MYVNFNLFVSVPAHQFVSQKKVLLTNTTRNKRYPSSSVNLFPTKGGGVVDQSSRVREPAEPQLPLLTKPILHPNEAFPEFPDFDTLDSLLKKISSQQLEEGVKKD